MTSTNTTFDPFAAGYTDGYHGTDVFTDALRACEPADPWRQQYLEGFGVGREERAAESGRDF